LNSLIQSNDYVTAVNEGVENVFIEYRDVWNFIVAHYDEHKKVPIKRDSKAASSGILNKLMVMLMLIPLKKILRDFDYQEYGGVPLLGVNGVIIIGHGKSSPLAIQNMLIRAVEVIQGNVNASIKQALAESTN